MLYFGVIQLSYDLMVFIGHDVSTVIYKGGEAKVDEDLGASPLARLFNKVCTCNVVK